jgi:hypothetical protein
LHDDTTYRLEQLAAGGAQQMLGTLHPRVAYVDNTVRISTYATGVTHLHRRGLLLGPCVFAWPDVLVGTADDPNVPTLTYSPYGLGRTVARAWASYGSRRTQRRGQRTFS